MATGMASSLSLGEGVSGLRLQYIILIQDFRCLPLEHLREQSESLLAD